MKECLRSRLVDVICVLILASLILKDIGKLNQLIILNDEFGYWSIAAQWAGKHWDGLIPYTPYYSCGYSLILVPLFWLSNNPVYLYRMAIIINVLLLILDFFLMKFIARKVFPCVNIKIISIASFTACLYPNVLYQSQVAWPETLLFTLFTVLSYFFLKYEEKATVTLGIGIGSIMAYMYMVHQRTIFIVIIGVLFVLYIQLLRGGSLKATCCALISLIIGLVIVRYVSNGTRIWWNSSPKQELNSISVSWISGYLLAIKKNIYNFLMSISGKIGYYFLVTGPVVLCGMWFGIKNILGRIRHISEKKQYCGCYLFWVSAFAVSVGECVLFSMQGNRLDFVVYGRYAENTIGIIVLFGILYLLKEENVMSLLCVSIIMMVLFSININNAFQAVTEKWFNVPCASGLGSLYNSGAVEDVETPLWTAVLIQCLIIIVIGLLLYLKRKYMSQIAACLILLAIGLYWGLTFHYARPYLEHTRNAYDYAYYDIVLPILEEYEDCELLYILDDEVDEYGNNAKMLQFVVMDRKINVMKIDDIQQELSLDILVLVEKKSNLPLELSDKIELVDSLEGTPFLLYKGEGENG